MKFVNGFLKYLAWLLLCLIINIAVVWLEIEYPFKDPISFRSSFWNSIFDIMEGLKMYIILLIGSILGVITFICFIPLEFYVIKRRFKEKHKRILMNITTILILAIAFKIIHYVLEYQLDWI